MSEAWYKVWMGKIEAVEVDHTTDSFIYVPTSSGKLRREAKFSEFQQYFREKEDAIVYIITKARRNVAACEASLQYAQNYLHGLEEKYLL